MDDSILLSIKKLLGISETDTSFDTDVLFHINSCFSVLRQLGIGPDDVFYISDEKAVWTDFVIGPVLALVRSYIFACVKLAFDPPTSASYKESLEKIKAEFEWRANVEVETSILSGS